MRAKLNRGPMSLMTSVALILGAVPAIAQSLPTNGSVAAGSASILTPSGTSLVVNQSSPGAIINWGTFSIGAGNGVTFNNGAGSTLNRVIGNVPSRIDGSLSATGSVYLVNPAGVAVGSTGQIATGGSFVASTLDIADDAFLRGGDKTFAGSSKATVVNAGSIGSLGGDVALIARAVDNTGTITAPKGTAALVAGYEVLVADGHLDGGKFRVKVGGADTEVKTRGKIQAATAELRANGGNVYALAGNTGGIVAATGTAKKGGRIFLTAGDSGSVEAGGTLTASRSVTAGPKGRHGATGAGASSGGDIRVSGGTVKVSGTVSVTGQGAKAKGGTVVVQGKAITLTDTAMVDASGATGGVILIGGDYQGGQDSATKLLPEAVATASTTAVAPGARLVADGSAGDGGHAVVWSDELTTFQGTLSARGAGDGRGGDAEVSGKAVLDFRGRVDLSAAHGAKGTLLLDPYDLTIYDGSSTAVTVPPTISATSEDALLDVAVLRSALDNGNVTVRTSNSAGTGSQTGNIVVATPVAWTGDTTLTLSAAGNVIVNAPVTATGQNAGLVVQYGVGSGYIVNAPITLSGSGAALAIGTAGALQSYTLIHSMADLQAIPSSGPSGRYALGQSLDATGTVYSNAIVTGSFTGTFAGLGNTISHLVIDAPGVDNVGLFANADYGSTVRDINLLNGSVTGRGSVGALAGIAAGKVSNASSNLTVVGRDVFVGGLVGLNSGGGSGIFDSHATGSVSGTSYVGGLAGNSQAPITRSYATGAVSGVNYVGGLAGVTGDMVSQTYATGAVTATGNTVGGLVGLNGMQIDSSYASGAVTGLAGTGGLVGDNYGGISHAYALGSVTGTSYVGGLVGRNQDGTVTGTYATGAVTGSDNLGGLVGSNSIWGTIDTSYWDKQTTGQSHSAGSADSFGLTTNQARQASSYAGWDFGTVWYQDGDMRPIARGEAAPAVGGIIAVSNVHQLQLINTDPTASYRLSADVDARATSGSNAPAGIWTGAGLVPLGSASTPFTGRFDGNGHTISNLTINQPSGNQVGLFGTTSAATIRNVGLVGGSIVGSSEVGSLIGHDDGSTVAASYSTATVSGAGTVGGLVGYSQKGTYDQLYATGAVTSQGSAGGLIGYAGGTTIDRSYASGDVSGRATVGGLIGTLKNSDDGQNVGRLTRSYATGAVTSGDDPSLGETVGGLVGSLQDGSISDSYATGSVTLTAIAPDGNDYIVGGFVGDNFYGTIERSYSTGRVDAAACATVACSAGGFAGRHGTGSIQNSYWDTGTSGLTQGIGSDPSSTDATGFATANAFSAGTYANFDFGGTWYLIAGETRPFLQAEWSSTIVNAHQLQLMTRDLQASYTLGANVDLSATVQSAQMWNTTKGFSPVGDASTPFDGTFDGTGHTISNLAIDRSGSSNSYAGLFGYTGSNAVIRNVGLDGGSVTGSDVSVGSLIGYNTGLVENVFSTASVQGDTSTGGLVGTNTGTIRKAYATGSVTATGGSSANFGGLVGYNSGDIENTYATGIVRDADVLGGLVGYNSGSISKSYAQGAVLGGPTLGALVGTNDGSISASYWVMGVTPGVYNGSGSVASSGDLTSSEFQDTAFFVSTATAAGWDFNTVWAPPSNGYNPVLYALTPVVWAKSVNTASTYGDSTAKATSTLSVGGPAQYVFGPAGDTVALDGRTIAVSPTASAGNHTVAITSQNLAVDSASGRSYRVFYYGDDIASIAKATLTATLTGTVTKVYNGSTTASLGSSNFSLSTLAHGGDDVHVAATTGTYGTADVGTGINVSVSGLTLSGTDADNYNLTTASLSGTIGSITQASLNAALTGTVGKVYDGNTSASVASANFSLSGLVNINDDVHVAATTGTYGSADVGSGIGVSVSGLTLTGTKAGNYSLSSTSLSDTVGSITRASLNAALTGTVGKVYDGNTSASVASANFSLSGLVNIGDDVHVAATTGTYGSADVGSGIGVLVSGLTLTGTKAGNYSLSTTSLSDTVGTITRASLNAALTGTVGKVYDGNTSASVASANFSLSGLVHVGDDVSVTAASGTYASAGVGTGIGVSASGLTLGGTKAGNYSLAASSISGTVGAITPAALSVTAADAAKIYGTVAGLNGTTGFSVAGLVDGDSVTSVALASEGTAATAGVGGYAITASDALGTGVGNYTITYRPGTMTVAPRPITVAANNAAMTAGAAVPPLTWTIAGGSLVNGDTLAGALATSATSSSGAGSYAILQGTLATSPNYTVTYVPGTLTVAPSSGGGAGGGAGPTPQQITTLTTIAASNGAFVQISAGFGGGGMFSPIVATGGSGAAPGMISPPGNGGNGGGSVPGVGPSGGSSSGGGSGGSGGGSGSAGVGGNATPGQGTGCTGGATASSACTAMPHPQNTRVGQFLRFGT